jgi:hypothetical protein
VSIRVIALLFVVACSAGACGGRRIDTEESGAAGKSGAASGSSTGGGSSAGGGGSGVSSGLPEDKRLSELSEEEMQRLCRFIAETLEGYGADHECFGQPVDLSASESGCQRSLPSCGASVWDAEECVRAMGRAVRMCDFNEQSDECAAIARCDSSGSGMPERCIEGQSLSCSCDGRMGAQVCIDGQLGPCQCASVPVCDPGSGAQCACANGATGIQVCNGAGTGWGPCECATVPRNPCDPALCPTIGSFPACCVTPNGPCGSFGSECALMPPPG